MELISLELYGKPFVQCFTISKEYRLPRELRDDACLNYIAEGSTQVISGTKTFSIGSGESVFMKCGNYMVISEGISPISPQKALTFHFDFESINKAFGSRDLSFLRRTTTRESIDPTVALGQNELIDGFVQSLDPYFNNKEMIKDDLLEVKLVELITILINSTNDPLVSYIFGTIESHERFEFDSVIEANIFNNLSIPELAHLTHRSVSKFKRDFKLYYKESPARYLKTLKLEKASELLRTSSLQVSEIAWDCGFDNVAHFSTSFTKQFGLSPRVYRENQNPSLLIG